jgi:hypothetical protein
VAESIRLKQWPKPSLGPLFDDFINLPRPFSCYLIPMFNTIEHCITTIPGEGHSTTVCHRRPTLRARFSKRFRCRSIVHRLQIRLCIAFQLSSQLWNAIDFLVISRAFALRWIAPDLHASGNCDQGNSRTFRLVFSLTATWTNFRHVVWSQSRLHAGTSEINQEVVHQGWETALIAFFMR